MAVSPQRLRDTYLPRVLGPLAGAVVRGPARGPGGHPLLYLTVDDGPDPDGTPRWLDALGRHGARAVFFLSAVRAEQHPGLVREITEAGHRVGSHGDAHVSAWRQRPAATRAAFVRAERVLSEIVGAPVRDLRPPYGRVTPGLVRWARGGRRVVLWDAMPGDFLDRTPRALADELVATVRPGSVVALHDGPPARRATAALGLALPRLRAAGWRLPLLP